MGIDKDVFEFTLLLPGQDVVALEALAHRHGMTVGQLVRHLIEGYLEGAQDRCGDRSRFFAQSH